VDALPLAILPTLARRGRHDCQPLIDTTVGASPYDPDMSRSDGGDPIACAACGEAIDPQVPVVIETRDGTLRVAALASLDRHELASAARVWHAACYSEDIR